MKRRLSAVAVLTVALTALVPTVASGQPIGGYIPPGFCRGGFALRVVNSILEWGGQEACNASGDSPASFYPHSIQVTLYMYAPNAGPVQVRVPINSASYYNHNAVITAYSNTDQCVSTQPSTYEMRSHTQAGSSGFDYLSVKYTVNCDIGEW